MLVVPKKNWEKEGSAKDHPKILMGDCHFETGKLK